MKVKLSKKKVAGKDTIHSKGIKDTYEPAKTEDRKKLLATIKKKIKSGYYDSEEVVDDLSESFAQVFDKTL